MTDTPAERDTLEEYRKEQAAEYGEFVAVEQIFYDGALAFNPGDAVPKSNVERHGYLDDQLVARRTTKAAQAVTKSEPAKS
jgi:hypothetical protein